MADEVRLAEALDAVAHNGRRCSMDFGEPIAEGTLNITSVTVSQGTTTLNYEGDVGKFGRSLCYS